MCVFCTIGYTLCFRFWEAYNAGDYHSMPLEHNASHDTQAKKISGNAAAFEAAVSGCQLRSGF